jgi:hypothetical protein
MSDPSIPQHLRHWGGLFERQGNRIVDAPPEDIAVARTYPLFPDKGSIISGVRLNLMSQRRQYRIGEEVRVVHVVEVVEPGREVYVMGPKPVYGEYVDDVLVPPPPDDVLQPARTTASCCRALRSTTTTILRHTVLPRPASIASNGASGCSTPMSSRSWSSRDNWKTHDSLFAAGAPPNCRA